MNNLDRVLSLGGVGHAPIMPGTLASLCAIMAWPILFLCAFWVRCLICLLCCLSSVVLLEMKKDLSGDPSWIVLDEVLAVLMIPCLFNDWTGSLWAWLLFRVFDILKPWPVSWAERIRRPSLAILLDDVVAVLASGLCLRYML